MGCSNPTIWSFIDVLKKEQDLTDWKINQKMMIQPPPPFVERLCLSNYSPGSALQFDRIELKGLLKYSACRTTVRLLAINVQADLCIKLGVDQTCDDGRK